MLSVIECPSFKRHHDASEAIASQRTSHRQQVPSKFPTPEYFPGTAPRQSVLQNSPPTPPDLQPPSESSSREAAPAWIQSSRVDNWLDETTPYRARSCPLQFDGSDLHVVSDPEQRPLLEVLQEMSRPTTSQTNYRKTLRNNGVIMDHTAAMIPPQLRSFLDLKILKERSTRLSSQAITDAMQTAIDIADSPEANMYDLFDTATLPIKRHDVGRGGNTPWASEGLPRNEDYPNPLATAKADSHCGYPIDQRSMWTARENAVIDHPAAIRLTQPAKGNSFPYLVLELKSEAMGGTLWQAENQAAGSGACCVNAARWILREASFSQEPSVVDTVAFSACVSHRQVVWHVHWFSAENGQYYMSWIATYDTLRNIQQCNDLTLNIFDHCQGERQANLRGALLRLYPIPNHWKQARPASAMSLRIAGEDIEDIGSNKSQGLDLEHPEQTSNGVASSRGGREMGGGKCMKGKERKGRERKGKARKGKARKGKEMK